MAINGHQHHHQQQYCQQHAGSDRYLFGEALPHRGGGGGFAVPPGLEMVHGGGGDGLESYGCGGAGGGLVQVASHGEPPVSPTCTYKVEVAADKTTTTTTSTSCLRLIADNDDRDQVQHVLTLPYLTLAFNTAISSRRTAGNFCAV